MFQTGERKAFTFSSRTGIWLVAFTALSVGFEAGRISAGARSIFGWFDTITEFVFVAVLFVCCIVVTLRGFPDKLSNRMNET